jgi:hypothetical protein
MSLNITEIAEAKASPASSRPPRLQRQNGASQSEAPDARFFLAKPDASGGAPALDRECATEAEAMAEAFKAGASYYAVTEYRSLVDATGKHPRFRKEVVKRNR